jgi:plasmid stabilization system protein ParE
MKTKKIIWTDSAKQDLRDIRAYIKDQYGVEVSKNISKLITDEVSSLKTSPNKGTIIDGMGDLPTNGFKQLLAGQNRIFIEHEADKIFIHLVCHTARDYEAHLRRRLLSLN